MAWPRTSTWVSSAGGSGSPAAIRSWSADQVEAGDGFGDRVLDLDAGVDLQEPERLPGGLEEELDRAGADVADGAGDGQGGVAQPARAACGSTAGDGASSTSFWCRRWIEHSRSNSWTMRPCVSARSWTSTWRGRLQPALEEHRRRRRRRAPAWRRAAATAVGQVARVADDPHADAAAAVGRLDQQGEPDLGGAPRPGRRRPARPPPHAGSTGTPARGRDPPGLQLVAQGGQDLGRRPDEAQPGAAARRRRTRRPRTGTRSRGGRRRRRCAGRRPGWRRPAGRTRPALRRGERPRRPRRRRGRRGRGR